MSSHRPAVEGAWIKCLGPRPRARWRLVGFAHAGGGPAAFLNWPRLLPDWIEVHAVHLPGRMARLREAPITAMDVLMRRLAPALGELMDRPTALYGHSLGALLAFETARAQRRAGARSPEHLFVSGAPAPHLPRAGQPIHNLPEPDFLAHLMNFGGTPPEVFSNEELRAIVLPALRADFALGASYQYQPEPPLTCALTAFGGANDANAGRADLEAWQSQADGPFALRVFPGGHFFVREHETDVTQAIVDSLEG